MEMPGRGKHKAVCECGWTTGPWETRKRAEQSVSFHRRRCWWTTKKTSGKDDIIVVNRYNSFVVVLED
jgi:hypothetical protein